MPEPFSPTALFEFPDLGSETSRVCFANPSAVYEARILPEVLLSLQRAEQASREGRWVVIVLSYEAAPAFDSAFRVNARTDFPLSWVAVFGEPCPPPEECWPKSEGLSWKPMISRAEYLQSVAGIRNFIALGDSYQVNYTFPLCCQWEDDSWSWYCRLRGAQNAPYCSWIDLGRYQILSLSPELFFQRRGTRLLVRPMKGTAPRGLNAMDDDNLKKKLQASSKDRAENVMIVDLLRNDLGKISLPGSVQVTHLCQVEQYPTLFQMTSTIESTCTAETSLGDIMQALFPCGSVTGAPKIRSMELIREFEPYPRNVYTGAIGLLRPGGDCTFNVAIRTALVDKETRQAVFGVGSGITWESSAEDEYEECLLKARFLTQPPVRFQLVETLRLESGSYFLLEPHLDRMRQSARYFGFAWDERVVRAALEEKRLEHPNDSWRIRLLLAKDGRPETQVAHLTPLATQEWRVAIAADPVASQDLFLYHKTTHRQLYHDQMQRRPDCDDLIFWNERGEVTESSRANVVLIAQGEKWTPPVRSGLLAGTYRNELLSRGEIRERVFYKEDLRQATAVFLINSVRKWIPVALV
ncbi:MAG: aminodeoxychorismate synthase component I [Acidobacteriota bacterium]